MANRSSVIYRIIQVLKPITRRFYNDDALANGVADRGEVIRPPLNRNVTELTGPGGVGTRPVNLQQDDITPAQFVRCLADSLS